MENVHQEDEFVAACRENNVPAVTHYLTVEGVDANKGYKQTQIEPGTNRVTMVTVTALQLATTLGHDQIVDALIQAGADVDQAYIYQENTPLFTVGYRSYYGKVVSLLLAAEAEPPMDGHTPLLEASRNGNEQVTRLLLAAKADPNVARDDGVTPLFVACYQGNDKIVNLLLEARANPNMARKDGTTPLWVASDKGNDKIVSLLLGAQADPSIANSQGRTPLFTASLREFPTIVSRLLEARADPNIADHKGVTPLLIATQQRGNDTVVSLLLDAQADANIASHIGVHAATACGQLERCQDCQPTT